MTEHEEFIEIINKWGGKIRYWKDTPKFRSIMADAKIIDIPEDEEYELVSPNQLFIESMYGEYI